VKAERDIIRYKPENPRFDVSLRRRETMPVTLLDASTCAKAAIGLQAIAAGLHAGRPCHAQALQKHAAAMTNGWTAAQSIAALTDTPAAEVTLGDKALADPTLKDVILGDRAVNDAAFIQSGPA
jgi:hypothetical protein